MIIVTRAGTPAAEIAAIEDRIRNEGLKSHQIEGANLVIIGVIGDPPEDFRDQMKVFPGVERVVRISAPYKLAGAGEGRPPTEIRVGDVTIGGGGTVVIAGPCTIESREQLLTTAEKIKQAGELADQPGHLIDIMATCLDAAGAEYPTTHAGEQITPLEGKSLLPIFDGRQRDQHEAVYWEHEGNRAVRRGNQKLVSRYGPATGGAWELYDLDADRTEMNDLAPTRPEQVAELSEMYEAWARRANVVPWKSWA